MRKKTLVALIRHFGDRLQPFVESPVDRAIAHVSSDSNRVAPGTVFCALAGAQTHGACYALQAIRDGACAVLVEPSAPPKIMKNLREEASMRDVPVYQGPRLREWLHELANWVYDDPSKKIKLVAVTGTSGKTTVCYLMEAIARAQGWPCGVLGTVSNRINGRIFPATLTTPQPDEIISMLARMVYAKCRFCFMEATSQAIHRGRLEGLHFDRAVFMNLSRDHLDYHQTMGQYFAAKEQLFTRLLKKSSKTGKMALVNMGDAWGRKLYRKLLSEKTAKPLLFGGGVNKKSDFCLKRVSPFFDHTDCEIAAGKERMKTALPLIGSYNAVNALAAAAACRSLGMSWRAIARGIAALKGVPGRLEKISKYGQPLVLVDYAHKPEALKNVIEALRALPRKGRLIVVIGCGGDRDPGKRPIMGALASRLADLAVFTSDNPRSEDPRRIIDMMIKGPESEGRRNFVHFVDRRRAIRYAIFQAQSEDCVLVAGKGHETYQIFRDRRVHFDDREICRKYLSKWKT
ncbi:MAG: UDP-N-acetylmuramoyl-L-alanyl-D-glutamate--2,6-diaminopimelate ligase [Elusimicrobia bacterium]|nr:UDP-N-acetylmuramoyl-L-alanyl-D-glutamate--2,6-diaminopimelate ligase [Elusimicrobiota bacterium]